ncbi:type IV pilin protein [Ectobacillus panaciterrae]|uniref:type IV pilin protein n=1 Tax=Ectobacillus panaciterrae TaxID=363872 RepID=UPI0003F5DF5C|nr:prepilin-type N-terminal cleavage/methylation domain-containing protein [Ectobacillus panaciterrae]
MFKKFLKNEKGLTLVELLAVIVILGIVAAIAVPTIGSVIQKSKENAIKADALQVLSAAKTYVAENGIPTTTTGTISKDDLDKYIDKADLSNTYSVKVSSDGKVFQLTTNAITVGKITITFNDATVSTINADKDYGKNRTINATGSAVTTQ